METHFAHTMSQSCFVERWIAVPVTGAPQPRDLQFGEISESRACRTVVSSFVKLLSGSAEVGEAGEARES